MSRPLPLLVAALCAASGPSIAFSVDPTPERIVMPASGVVLDALPTELASRWASEGTLIVTMRDARPVDRLLGFDSGGARVVTIDIRRDACGPPPPPGTTSPWPTLGYAGIRTPLPERRALRSCKAPDLLVELRFPAGIDTDPESLLAEADRWESVVTALHSAYGATQLDIATATANRAKLTFEAAPDAPDALSALTLPLTLRSGLAVDRVDDRPWLIRDLGGHDVLTLLAPTGAGLALQLLPFGPRYDCKVALAAALKSQPPADGSITPPPGWVAARAIGTDRAAFCVKTKAGGLIAIGGARTSRDTWLPIALPMLERLAEVAAR